MRVKRNYRIPVEVDEFIKRLAKQNKISEADVIVRALRSDPTLKRDPVVRTDPQVVRTDSWRRGPRQKGDNTR